MSKNSTKPKIANGSKGAKAATAQASDAVMQGRRKRERASQAITDAIRRLVETRQEPTVERERELAKHVAYAVLYCEALEGPEGPACVVAMRSVAAELYLALEARSTKQGRFAVAARQLEIARALCAEVRS